jgi:hypothetical protein
MLLERAETWENLFTPQEFTKNGPADWFYYFFAEAKYAVKKDSGSKSGLKKAAMVEVMEDLFVISPDHQYKEATKMPEVKTTGMTLLEEMMLKKQQGGLLGGAKNTSQKNLDKRVFHSKESFDGIALNNPERLRKNMTKLLEIGFKKLIADPTAWDSPEGLTSDDKTRLERQREKGYLTKLEKNTGSICWRGDNRHWTKINETKGLVRRVQNQEEYDKFNLSQPWHPYSDPNIIKYYWFRFAQGDNCYHTALSIGMNKDWRVCLPFPKISDLGKRPELIGRVTAQVDTTGPLGGNTIELNASVSTIYLFVVDGMAVDTSKVLAARNQKFEGEKKGGSTFPEYGLREVPWENVFGYVNVIRIWHGETDAEGFTAFVQRRPFSRQRYELDALNERLFGDLLPELKSTFKQFADVAAPKCMKWSATGFEENVKFVWPAKNPKNTSEKRIEGRITDFRWLKRPANLPG